jgi:hypothetical protein
MDTVYSLKDAETWFLKNSTGKVICQYKQARLVCSCYQDALRFFVKANAS